MKTTQAVAVQGDYQQNKILSHKYMEINLIPTSIHENFLYIAVFFVEAKSPFCGTSEREYPRNSRA
jgi:hypothetical protein